MAWYGKVWYGVACIYTPRAEQMGLPLGAGVSGIPLPRMGGIRNYALDQKLGSETRIRNYQKLRNYRKLQTEQI